MRLDDLVLVNNLFCADVACSMGPSTPIFSCVSSSFSIFETCSRFSGLFSTILASLVSSVFVDFLLSRFGIEEVDSSTLGMRLDVFGGVLDCLLTIIDDSVLVLI